MAHKAVDLARRELEPKPSLPFALDQWAGFSCTERNLKRP